MINYLTEKDRERFVKTVDRVTAELRAQGGIGTLQEKTLHASIKSFCEENPAFHEQKLCGYVADIFDGSSVTEIQTRSFYKLRGKLQAFLPLYPVTVVYPVIHRRTIYKVDTRTGEVGDSRKSPKICTFHNLFPELYTLCEVINQPRLKFRVLVVNANEYRLFKGPKDRGTKGDIIPTEILADYRFDCLSDFEDCIPEGLGETFTLEEYRKAAKINKVIAGDELRVLARIGVIAEAGRTGRTKTWRYTGDGSD